MIQRYIALKLKIAKLKDSFASDDDGASLVEYSVLIGLITVGAVAAIVAVGGWVNGQWTALEGALGIGGGG